MARAIPEERLQELIDAATRVFLDQGYRRTQMADVAARLGVAKGTLYLYVESKEALFHAVVEHADRPTPVALPDALPLATPAPGETLEILRKRVEEEATLPALNAALARARVGDVNRELDGILRELYDLLAAHRFVIKLLERCAHDQPALAAVWHEAGRRQAMTMMARYLADRVRRRRLPAVHDPALTARIVIEVLAFWAVHRHWDPSPQPLDEGRAREAVLQFLLRAILGCRDRG